MTDNATPSSSRKDHIARTFLIRRQQPCRLCGELSGRRVGKVDYWNLLQADLVECPACAHTQLDPMPGEEATAKGCLAYYREESSRVTPHEEQRNRIRNFRRGVLFARQLQRKGIRPRTVLELGPGSGYFCAGLQFLFPELKVTVMDINPELLGFNRQHHGYETAEGIPDNFLPALGGRFDLVVARDILEHVTDVPAVIRNVYRYLSPGGHFHFITPNGREDGWKHRLTFTLTGQPSELLINHVNYFDGAALRQLLEKSGFRPLKYYTYTFKTTLRGRGWKQSRKLMAPVSVQRDAALYLNLNPVLEQKTAPEQTRRELLQEWYIRPAMPWLAVVVACYQHGTLLHLRPERNVGHEVFGLFEKIMTDKNDE